MLNQFSFFVPILQFSPVTEVVCSTLSLKLAWEVRIAHRNWTWTFREMWCQYPFPWAESSSEQLVPWPKVLKSYLVHSDFCSIADLGVFGALFQWMKHKQKFLNTPFPYKIISCNILESWQCGYIILPARFLPIYLLLGFVCFTLCQIMCWMVLHFSNVKWAAGGGHRRCDYGVPYCQVRSRLGP